MSVTLLLLNNPLNVKKKTVFFVEILLGLSLVEFALLKLTEGYQTIDKHHEEDAFLGKFFHQYFQKISFLRLLFHRSITQCQLYVRLMTFWIKLKCFLNAFGWQFVLLLFELQLSAEQESFFESWIQMHALADLLNGLLIFMKAVERSSQPKIQIFLCIRVLKVRNNVPGKRSYFFKLLIFKQFLNEIVFFFEEVMIYADRMVISFDRLNYFRVRVHPDDSFLLVCMFFWDMFLLKEIAKEAGWLFRIF